MIILVFVTSFVSLWEQQLNSLLEISAYSCIANSIYINSGLNGRHLVVCTRLLESP